MGGIGQFRVPQRDAALQVYRPGLEDRIGGRFSLLAVLTFALAVLGIPAGA